MLAITAVCSLKAPIGSSSVSVTHWYGAFEVSNTANCGKAGTLFIIPPNKITRPSEAKKKKN